MDIAELKQLTADALGKDITELSSNPEWDSLDKLEIIAHLHDVLGEKVNEVDGLDDFFDLESLANILRKSDLVA